MNPKPDTVSEEAARPEQVDWPEQESTITLPAQRTESPGIVDTGFQWEQEFPGDKQGMPKPDGPILSANRVTQVSDTILFGSAILTANDPPFILVPAHRDRLRVTIQVYPVGESSLSVYLASTPDIVAGFSAWQVFTTDPLIFETRDTIYVAVGATGETVSIQWASEMVSE